MYSYSASQSKTTGSTDPLSSSPGDLEWQFHIDNLMPGLELPTIAAPPCHLPQGIIESPTLYAGNLVGSFTSVGQCEPFTPGAAQAQLDEQDDGVDAGKPPRPQYLKGHLFDYPNDEFGHPAYSGQTMVEAQTIAAQTVTIATTVGLPLPSTDAHSLSAQVSDAMFMGFDFLVTDGPDINKPQPDANSCPRRITFSLDQGDYTSDPVSEIASTSSMANAPILARTDNSSTATYPSTNASTDFNGHALYCLHPSCNSKAVFLRQCDLNKHYRSHLRKFPCRSPNCHLGNRTRPMFVLRKDRDRHESAHKPSIPCRYCRKIFSRRDNLRDHCRTQHQDLI